MSDDKTQAAISKGARASRLLGDAIFTETFDALEAQYVKAWKETAARDDDARQRYWLAINQLGKIKEHLRIIADNGKLAQAQLNQLAKGSK